MEPLELVGVLCGQAHGVPVVGYLPAGVQHLAAEQLGFRPVQAVDLSPEDMADLPERRSGAERDGGVLVGVQEPEQGHGGAEPLTQAVAGFDRHPAVFHQGAKHFALFVPEFDAKNVGGELYRCRGDARMFLHAA